MFLRPVISAATMAIALCLPAAPHPGENNESKKQQALLEIENHWLQVEDDPDALEAILADDFIHVLPFGFVTKAEQLRYMRSHPTPASGAAKHFEELHARMFGSAGVVTGIVVTTTQDGKTQKTIFTDVFVYRDGRWQAANAQELPFRPSSAQ